MDKKKYTKTGTNIDRVREQNRVGDTEFGKEMDPNRPATPAAPNRNQPTENRDNV